MNSTQLTLHFNLPDGWKTDFRIEEITDEEIGESATFENYTLTPPENDELFDQVLITKDITGCEHGGADDLIEYYAQEYLDGLNLPDSLCPSLGAFIHDCVISGQDAYYIVRQRPGEASAEVLVILHAPDRDLVEIRADIKDWGDGCGEVTCLDFLTDLIQFD